MANENSGKIASSNGGKHHLDDYTDAAAYVALAGETAEGDQGFAELMALEAKAHARP